jgi:hypothetical protein
VHPHIAKGQNRLTEVVEAKLKGTLLPKPHHRWRINPIYGVPHHAVNKAIFFDFR